jgi:putative spermidine/putrescine transport system substrate-binding protein
MLYANVLAYNTERVEGTPSSWADFFNTRKFPGRRGLHKVPSETLEVALLADGVLLGDLYPLDVNRALGKLDTIKDQIQGSNTLVGGCCPLPTADRQW